jgi:hypothetical protein
MQLIFAAARSSLPVRYRTTQNRKQSKRICVCTRPEGLRNNTEKCRRLATLLVDNDMDRPREKDRQDGIGIGSMRVACPINRHYPRDWRTNPNQPKRIVKQAKQRRRTRETSDWPEGWKGSGTLSGALQFEGHLYSSCEL